MFGISQMELDSTNSFQLTSHLNIMEHNVCERLLHVTILPQKNVGVLNCGVPCMSKFKILPTRSQQILQPRYASLTVDCSCRFEVKLDER